MVHQGYIITQIVLAVLNAVMFGFFMLQLRIEHAIHEREISQGTKGKKRKIVGNIQWAFHRAGPVSCVFLCLRTIDPVTVHGYFPLWVVDLLSYNVNVVILSALAAVFYFTIEVSYNIVKTKVPHIYRVVFISSSVALFIWSNVCVGLHGATDDSFYFYGLYLFGIGVFGIITFGTFDIGAFQLYRILRQFQNTQQPSARARTKSTSGNENKLKKAVNRLKVFQITSNVIAVICCLFDFYLAIQTVTDSKQSQDPDPKDFDVALFGFMFLQTLLVIVMLWYSWVPIKLLKTSDGVPVEEDGVSENGASRFTRNRKSTRDTKDTKDKDTGDNADPESSVAPYDPAAPKITLMLPNNDKPDSEREMQLISPAFPSQVSLLRDNSG